MLDGGKVNPDTGVFYTKEIGLQTIKDIVDSAKGLSKSDVSPEAMKTRNISGLEVMDGMEFCAKIGVEKGTNGYADKNEITGFLFKPSAKPRPAPKSAPVETPSSSGKPWD